MGTNEHEFGGVCGLIVWSIFRQQIIYLATQGGKISRRSKPERGVGKAGWTGFSVWNTVATMNRDRRQTTLMVSKAIKIIAVLLLAVVVVAGFAWWWLFTIPISQTQLQRLTPGMTSDQVYAVLGTANQTNISNRVTNWYYSRRPAVLALVVSFDYRGFTEYVID